MITVMLLTVNFVKRKPFFVLALYLTKRRPHDHLFLRFSRILSSTVMLMNFFTTFVREKTLNPKIVYMARKTKDSLCFF